MRRRNSAVRIGKPCRGEEYFGTEYGSHTEVWRHMLVVNDRKHLYIASVTVTRPERRH